MCPRLSKNNSARLTLIRRTIYLVYSTIKLEPFSDNKVFSPLLFVFVFTSSSTTVQPEWVFPHHFHSQRAITLCFKAPTICNICLKYENVQNKICLILNQMCSMEVLTTNSSDPMLPSHCDERMAINFQ